MLFVRNKGREYGMSIERSAWGNGEASADAVVLEDVSKAFGAVHAVNGISATIPRGLIYGFLGPNGAGKTTTMRMMLNIIRQDTGTIRVFGGDPTCGVQDRIGYLPEERGLYRKMTAAATLHYLGRLKGVPRSVLLRAVPEWLERVELGGWGKRRVEELSKGMQQKLQFAATVLHQPDLVILDEPFSGLDPVNLEVILDLMLKLRDQGKTVIFSTHVMEQAEKLCDRLLLINGGRKVVDGPLDEILQRYKENAVVLEVEGDTQFLTGLPFVESVVAAGHRLEVRLRPESASPQLYEALAGRVRVRLFQEKVPSLHEIFIRLVSGSNGHRAGHPGDAAAAEKENVAHA